MKMKKEAFHPQFKCCESGQYFIQDTDAVNSLSSVVFACMVSMRTSIDNKN